VKLTTPFTQSTAISTYESASGTKLPTRGLCFRVAFKWAACHAVGGKFKYLNLNASKTAAKHLQYRQVSLAKEQDSSFDFSDDTNIKSYVTGDQVQARTYLAAWGKRFKDGSKTEFSVTPGKEFEGDLGAFLAKNPIAGVQGLVYGFYGRTPDKKGPRGHAVALSGGASPLFFDPNRGEYTFDASEDVPGSVASHIAALYSAWTQDFYFVLPLSKT
jgi:hypothetical protein